jgi:alpha-L-rhamnosidase
MNRKVLRQMFAIQHETGAVPPYGPYRGCDSFYPAWTAYLGLALLDHYRLTGDRGFLDELRPNLERLLGWAIGQLADVGLIGTPARGMRYDEWERAPKVRWEAWANMPFRRLFAEAATEAAERGDAVASARYGEAAAQMDKAIRQRLFDPTHALCRSAWPDANAGLTQTDTALALWSGALDPGDALRAARELLDPTILGIGTPFNGLFVAEGLYRHGEPLAALDFIRRYWGDMLARGATTFWEHFSLDWAPGLLPDRGTSLCHGWSAGPTYSLPAHVLGVRLDMPRKRITVAPEPGDLTWARGTVPTEAGPVHVRWSRTDSAFLAEVDVPEGCCADVHLPFGGPHATVAVDGTKPVHEHGGTHVAYTVASGRHELVCR